MRENCEAAVSLARDKLRECPNSDQLAYGAVGVLSGVLELRPEEDTPDRQGWENMVTALYERCVRNPAPQMRKWLNLLLHSLMVPWDLGSAPLYCHLSAKRPAAEVQTPLLNFILARVERDSDCEFLQQVPGYPKLIQ